MDDGETTSVRRTVRLAVILLVVGGLYLAGFNVLLSVVVGMIPLWYTSGWGTTTAADDDTEPQRLAQRLHRAHRVAWHELADRAHLIDFLRSRVGRRRTPSSCRMTAISSSTTVPTGPFGQAGRSGNGSHFHGAAIRLTGHSLSVLRKQPDGRWVMARDANLLTPS